MPAPVEPTPAEPAPDHAEGAWHRVVQGASGTIVLRLFSTGIKILTTLFLARWLGAAEFGAYMYAMSWSLILVIPAALGSTRLVVREVATLFDAERFTALRRTLTGVSWLVIMASLVLVALASVAFAILAPSIDRSSTIAAYIILPLVPIVTTTIVLRASLEGTHRIIRAQLPEMGVQPVVLALGLAAAFYFGASSTAGTAAGVTVASYAAGLATSIILVTMILGRGPRDADDDRFDAKSWLVKAAPLLVVGITAAVNTRLDMVMLGVLSTSESTGVYGLVSVAASVLAMVFMSLQGALGPQIVRLHSGGQRAELQRLITRSIRVVLAVSIAGGAALLAAAYWGLGLLGPEYPAGWIPLAVLVAGALAGMAAGPAGLILIMTHHEKHAAKGLVLGMITNVVLNAVLIPRYGATGAAVATLCCTVAARTYMLIRVRQLLGIDSTVLGLSRREVPW